MHGYYAESADFIFKNLDISLHHTLSLTGISIGFVFGWLFPFLSVLYIDSNTLNLAYLLFVGVSSTVSNSELIVVSRLEFFMEVVAIL